MEIDDQTRHEPQDVAADGCAEIISFVQIVLFLRFAFSQVHRSEARGTFRVQGVTQSWVPILAEMPGGTVLICTFCSEVWTIVAQA